MDNAILEAPMLLVADDDPAIVRLLADRCTKYGFNVETAFNGLQALIKANRINPDVLIIDVSMPEVDGFSVCKRLLDPTRRSVDVIVITGRRDPETEEQCEILGAHYISKGPDFWDRLAAALAEILPNMAARIGKGERHSVGTEVRAHPRILLVDADPDVERFFSSRLGKYGVELLYAPDAIQGFRIAYREAPSVIITDYIMQNGDAYYLLWRLRTTPATASIPVFVLTERRLDEGTLQNLKREICGHPGAARVFRKSLDTQELFDALQHFCAFEKKSAMN